jgi:hypothetical protein
MGIFNDGDVMGYTLEMQRAFRSIRPPKNFTVDIFDHENFLTVRADEIAFYKLADDQKRAAVEYMVRVKKALEANGAIVLLERNPVK